MMTALEEGWGALAVMWVKYAVSRESLQGRRPLEPIPFDFVAAIINMDLAMVAESKLTGLRFSKEDIS